MEEEREASLRRRSGAGIHFGGNALVKELGNVQAKYMGEQTVVESLGWNVWARACKK